MEDSEEVDEDAETKEIKKSERPISDMLESELRGRSETSTNLFMNQSDELIDLEELERRLQSETGTLKKGASRSKQRLVVDYDDSIYYPGEKARFLSRTSEALRLRHLEVIRESYSGSELREREDEMIVRAAVESGFHWELARTLLNNRRYLILDLLPEQGALSKVFKAISLDLGIMGVIKLIRETRGHSFKAVGRAQRAARIIANLRSRHVVRVRFGEFALKQYGVYYIMDLAEGLDVGELIKPHKPLPAEEVVKIALSVLDVLIEIHDKGIAHRDIKPANIIISREVMKDGEVLERYLLTDFDLAKPLEEESAKQRHLKKVARLIARKKATRLELQVLGVGIILQEKIKSLVKAAKELGLEEFLDPRFAESEENHEFWKKKRAKYQRFFSRFNRIADALEMVVEPSRGVSSTDLGSILGTPLFMSPEQAIGDMVGVESDIFSLGQTLYRLLSGINAFLGATATILATEIARYKHTHLVDALKAMKITDVSDHLAHTVEWAMERYPKDRPSARQVRDEILRYQRGLGPSKFLKRAMQGSKWSFWDILRFWRK